MSRIFRSARPLPTLAGSSPSVRGFHSSRIAREQYLKADEKTFESVIKSGEPSVVQFTAGWCQPCKLLGPIIKRNTGPESGVNLLVVDVDQQGSLASQFKVSSIPYVVGFKGGKMVDLKLVGMQPEAKIKAFIEQLKA